ncbi:MAG: acyl-CoA dehydrogenase family protein [Candidatus Nanoarchaeia archaeon]
MSVFDRIEAFCKELRPLEDIYYLEGKYNDQLIPLVKKYGILGMPVEKKYGGGGMSTADYCEALRRIGQEGTGIRTFFSGHTSLGQKCLQEFGSEYLKKEYLRPSCKGKKILAWALTEPEAGSDPKSLRTKYRKVGDGYVLNGDKYLISNAGIADAIIVFAKGSDGMIACFVVDSESKGLTREDMVAKMGMHTINTGMFNLKNVKVLKKHMIGKPKDGWKIAMHCLLNGRLSVAAGCVGVMEDTLRECVRYAKERKQHGKAIAKHQLIQEHIAMMKTQLEASRLMVRKAASLKDSYDAKRTKAGFITVDTAIAEAKFYAVNAAFDVADRGVQIYGGRGWSYLFRPGRHMVDTRVCRIYEGTDEIMKLKIALSVLGREYSAFR